MRGSARTLQQQSVSNNGVGETCLFPLWPLSSSLKAASEKCFFLKVECYNCTNWNTLQRSMSLTVITWKRSQRSHKLVSAWDPQAVGLQGERAKSHPSCYSPARVSLGLGLCTSNTWLLTWSWQIPQQIPLSQRADRFSQPEGREGQPSGGTQLVQPQLRKLH